MNVLKLTSIREVDPFDLYDISVEEDECFRLTNGIIAHNSMYPKAIVGGGCLFPGTKIQTPTGVKSVEDFVVGDVVVTKLGNREVTAVWNPETLIDGTPDCYEIEFEDGTIVKCSAEHKFLINGEWIAASNINVGMDAEVVAS